MSSAAVSHSVVDVIVAEMAAGVDRAVEFWMSQIDATLADPHLTSLGRLQAVCEIVEKYKKVTGKTFPISSQSRTLF